MFAEVPAAAAGGADGDAPEVRLGAVRQGWAVAALVPLPAGLAAASAEAPAGRQSWEVRLPREADPSLAVTVEAPGSVRVVLAAARPGPFRARFHLAARVTGPDGGEVASFDGAVGVRATVMRKRDGKPAVRDGVTVLSRAGEQDESDAETDWKGF